MRFVPLPRYRLLPVPGAKSVAASANNTTFTVTMNSNYKWSDGTPVTATDVQFCYNLMKEYGTKYAYYGIGGLPNDVKSFTVNSPTSFTIVTCTRSPSCSSSDRSASVKPPTANFAAQ